MINRKCLWIFVTCFLVFLVGQGFLLKLDFDKKAYNEYLAEYNKYEDRGLARININLNGVSLEEIDAGSKEIKYKGNVLDLYNSGQIYNYDDVEVKGRGNSTWAQVKKPYQIKFVNRVDLLGLGKSKKWVLLANYLDDSFLRNDIAFNLAEMLGIKYNSRGEYVELYFNDEYRGLYYITKKIEISKDSVDLREYNGVLFEIDTLREDNEECYTSYFEDCLVLKDAVLADGKDNDAVVMEFVKDFMKFEKALEKGNFEEVSKIVDVDSFAKYYLMNEFTINPDAYVSSFFLYRDDEGKICAGPVWDFDYALGNLRWGARPKEDEFFLPIGKEKNLKTKFMSYFVKIPEFEETIKHIFQEKMSGREEELINNTYETMEKIKMAAVTDNERWKRENFEAEAEILIDWIRKRYNYFEQEYGKNTQTDKNG